MKPTPEQIVKALQYLYYTGDGINRLGGSPLDDYTYDKFCDKHGIPGNGGGDCERFYTLDEVVLAERIAKSKGIEGL